jgi:hypothetical protein
MQFDEVRRAVPGTRRETSVSFVCARSNAFRDLNPHVVFRTYLCMGCMRLTIDVCAFNVCLFCSFVMWVHGLVAHVTDFDELNERLEKAASIVKKEGTPVFYFQIVKAIDDFSVLV